ncbi:MAG: AarF/ABC1/UbiB kinase family protein [Candidatus Korobacteraceae bacterium]
MVSQLTLLQDSLSAVSFRHLRTTFRNDFKIHLEEDFEEVDKTPIASASIASVFRARLRDGRRVAIKVRRPGISSTVEYDMQLLGLVLKPICWLPWARSIPIAEILGDLSRSLRKQVDFEIEASSNDRVRKNLRAEDRVKVPALIRAYCSKSVLTMEYCDALEDIRVQPIDRRLALTNALRALYRMIFIDGFVHCDMHPGNCRLLHGGNVILLDFGLMAELEDKVRIAFAEFFYAMVVNDGYTCAVITLETASHVPKELDRSAFTEEMILLVERYSGQKVTCFQVSGFVLGLFDIQRKYGVRGTPAFVWAIISLLVFEGVAKTIDPELDFQGCSLWYVQHALNMRRRSANYQSLSTGQCVLEGRLPIIRKELE